MIIYNKGGLFNNIFGEIKQVYRKKMVKPLPHIILKNKFHWKYLSTKNGLNQKEISGDILIIRDETGLPKQDTKPRTLETKD
jgi:hypothetical protein